MLPTVEDFKRQLSETMQDAREQGLPYIDVESGDLHRKVGGYPNGGNHRMPVCCHAMRGMMQGNDEVLHSPDSGQGATLKIRYYLSPRPAGNTSIWKTLGATLRKLLRNST